MPVFIQMDTQSERIGYTAGQEGERGDAGSRQYRRANQSILRADTPYKPAGIFSGSALMFVPLRPSSEALPRASCGHRVTFRYDAPTELAYATLALRGE